MTWLDMGEQRDAEGNLTDLALALNAISDVGCACGTDEGGSCVGCLCEQALKGLWEQLDSAKAEVARLKAQPTATAEQERNRVLRYLSDRACHLKITDSYEGSRALERAERAIEKGEHWPKDKGTL